MNLDREQAEIIMTALQNYRGELYIDGSNSLILDKVNKTKGNSWYKWISWIPIIVFDEK